MCASSIRFGHSSDSMNTPVNAKAKIIQRVKHCDVNAFCKPFHFLNFALKDIQNDSEDGITYLYLVSNAQ